MADQSPGPLGLPPTVWVVVIVGLAGALAASQHPFQDVRPGGASTSVYRHAPSEDQDVEARQWEDPFSAVAIARATQATKSGAASPSDDDSHQASRLNTDRAKDPAHLLVVGTMVPGAPYADDIETRRRTRYAVLAGLYQEGYVPDDSEHIGFIYLPELSAAVPHNIATYEWLHTETPAQAARNPRILLLWLDQDGFRDRPLARFSLIVGKIAVNAPTDAVSAVIVGPADSAGLQAMSTELDQGPQNDCEQIGASRRHLSIYSPRATALDWLIVSDQVKSRFSDTSIDQNAAHFHDRCANVDLYRTVSSDFTVVSALYKELQYRGIRNVGEIALITERDTLYSRLISRYFNECEGTESVHDRFTVTRFGEDEGSAASDVAADKIHPQCFTYLRGLDGLAPPAPNSADAAQSAADAKSGATPGPPAPLAQESATGQGQFDYLRRLAAALASARDDPACRWVARILAVDEAGDSDPWCGRRIKAIGVVGSDIYDKLLVLQALRPAFPRSIFFTTDLDARLTDGQNLQWTRGLVVGSSLGLSLRPELQESVPPFRDSYQTATYYSIRQAVRQFLDAEAQQGEEKEEEARDLADVDLFWTARPHVYEIGRTQAFDLSAHPDSNSPCGKLRECPSIAASRLPPVWSTGSFSFYLMCAGLVMLTICLATGAAMGRPWVVELVSPTGAPLPRKRLIVALLLLVIAAAGAIIVWSVLVHALADHGRRIPAPIFSGASHWTAGMVEALSIVLVITLVLRGHRMLNTNAAEMLRAFKIPLDAPTLIGKYRSWLTLSGDHRRWKERLWFPIRRLSGNKKDPLVRPNLEGTRPAAAPLEEISELEALVGQYLYRGRWSARFVRVGIATVISSCVLLALEYTLMLLEFNLGISLVNGFAFIDFHYVERGVESIISFMNLLAIQFLIFWVADALFLTRSFALALAKDRPHWPPEVLEEKARELGLCKPLAALWFDLRLIAWRTGRVANLIWYPSIMLALMAAAALTVEFGDLGFASNPIALAISAGFVIGAAVMLRLVAESWRSDVLSRLDDDRLRALGMSEAGAPGVAAQQVAQLECLSERVRALAEGAFAPYSQQPLVRAVLVPAITYGTTVGLQYLHLNG